MTLRARVLLAQLPLLAALAAVVAIGAWNLGRVARHSDVVFRENFRSVLATQAMKEAAERMDSAALMAVSGERDRATEQAAASAARFESELRAQEGNVSEQGEAGLTRDLRREFEAYRSLLSRSLAAGSLERGAYFAEHLPRFLAVKQAADEILALNQDAMLAKNERIVRHADRMTSLLWLVAIAAAVGGVLVSSAMTARILRPLRVLEQAVGRIAQGDLDVRASVVGSSELSRLGAAFNRMAERLRSYRDSSLGELLETQAAAQSAIDSIPDPVIVFAANGQVLSVNGPAEHELGVVLEGTNEPLARADPAVREVVERVRGHVLAGRGPYVPRGFEESVRVQGPEGDRFLLPRATPVHGEGGLRGATVVLQDVTRLRRFDELKNDLVATVAHEFRTPLTSLRMALHLCLEGAAGPLTDKQQDLLGAARDDCERLQAIVDDLLDLARLQGGKIDLRREVILAGELMEEAAGPHRVAAEDMHVALDVFPAPTDARVSADRERIGLVFSNLIANALRHTPEGGRVELHADPGDGEVRFSVHDSGPGLPPEELRRVFEKFYRAPGTAGQGAGLGLTIAAELVAAHGGRIGAESAPGQGATFWFTLPAVRG